MAKYLAWPLIAILPLTGCSKKESAPPPPKLDDQPFKQMTYEQACAAAKDHGRTVFVDFYTTWCGWCKVLDQTTWEDPQVKKWLVEKTVAIKLDAEKTPALVRKLGVQGYPALFLLKPDGTVIRRIDGYVKPQQFLAEMKGAVPS